MIKRLIVCITCLVLALPGFAQRNKLQYVRITEENDALNVRRETTDREYTNGTRADVFYTKTARPRFLSALLISVKGDTGKANNIYNIGLTQSIYTPSDISQRNIIRQSRPYTGVLYVAHGLTSSDPVHHQRLTTELGLGVLGKAALGKEIQTWYHETFNYAKPQGWANQLPTDIILTYLIQYEKLIIQPSPNLQIIGLISANMGSLSNNINAGITFRAGIFNDYFSNNARPVIGQETGDPPAYRRFQFYFYMRPVGRLVMDDAILQGGFFSHNSAKHVIDRDLLKRGFVQFEYGTFLGYKRVGVSLSEKLITAQYEDAPSQQVGSLTFYIGL